MFPEPMLLCLHGEKQSSVIITSTKWLDQTCKHMLHGAIGSRVPSVPPPTLLHGCPSSPLLPRLSVFCWLPLCLIGLYCKFFSKCADHPHPGFCTPGNKGILKPSKLTTVEMLPECLSPGLVVPLPMPHQHLRFGQKPPQYIQTTFPSYH